MWPGLSYSAIACPLDRMNLRYKIANLISELIFYKLIPSPINTRFLPLRLTVRTRPYEEKLVVVYQCPNSMYWFSLPLKLLLVI